jgi:LysM repeat protein
MTYSHEREHYSAPSYGRTLFPDAATVLSGLVPTILNDTASAADEPGPLRRAVHTSAKTVLATLPVVLVGSMALTGPGAPPSGGGLHVGSDDGAEFPRRAGPPATTTIRSALAAAGSAVVSTATPAALRPAALPTSYRVRDGDTVTAIAGRFGVSTASVLAANGLGWKSLIFPGQTLKLSTATPNTTEQARPQKPGHYTIVAGDTITRVAARYGVSAGTLLAANNLRWTSIIYPGQTILIPGDPAPASHRTALAPAATSYVIRSGDTITHIAARFGVSAQALLDANGISRSSTIYVGRTLTIPADGGVPQLTDEMRANARTIMAVGHELGVPAQGIVIALATAMQESSLRNIGYGDRDSVGVFQQRPSAGWGAAEQLLEVRHAARLFFGGASNPNRGVTRGLLDIPDWQAKTLTAAAQAVQISAHPGAYAKWEKSARAWYAALS